MDPAHPSPLSGILPTLQGPDRIGGVMTKTWTYDLYVNLSASQVRKRLKGYGFGVRKVEAVDRNRAVVVHTATGEHRRQLEALLSDVISPSPEE